MTLELRDTKDDLGKAISDRLVTEIVAAQRDRGVAHIVLTGGSMGGLSLQSLPSADDIDWSNVHFWWGDERFVPAGAADRNDLEADKAALHALPVPAENIHRVAGPEHVADVESAASAYSAAIRAPKAGDGMFDIVMLGMGPDGHVASLFPHHPAQRTEDAIAIAVHDSPKPPPDRVSLTFECLNRSRQVWLLVAGDEKAEAVAAAHAPDADRWDVPAAGVRGADDTVWWLDAAAAAKLPGTE
ncbi:6-phosphogluconolactonase [Flexivirga endophytica]|uniref:6-phosphogluconolactonase n=1 Tax=Flexivirga endophytica TaxID=1849103 RepID=A0A916T858_9MICO|nr:6-phosphogluconolactonase [Flexivirga endophytica]GGB34076.1 6-phosphogluconolactonase [Flexivirga endophytica]GHB42045.1 6-phosphogluconolactonase [Flexivirga endophytica]